MAGKKNCILCGSKTKEIRVKKLGRYHVCSCCDFISKDKKNYLTLEEEKARYDRHNNSFKDPDYIAYFNDFLDKAVFPFVKGREGLDFGSGPVPVLGKILSEDYGYDMDLYDLNYAPEKVYQGKKYDLITSTEVVEHLSDPMEVFKLFQSLLKKDGILAIMTTFHDGNLKDFKEWYYIRDRSHKSFYTLKTLEYIGNQVGLEVIYSDGERYTSFSLREG